MTVQSVREERSMLELILALVVFFIAFGVFVKFLSDMIEN